MACPSHSRWLAFGNSLYPCNIASHPWEARRRWEEMEDSRFSWGEVFWLAANHRNVRKVWNSGLAHGSKGGSVSFVTSLTRKIRSGGGLQCPWYLRFPCPAPPAHGRNGSSVGENGLPPSPPAKVWEECFKQTAAALGPFATLLGKVVPLPHSELRRIPHACCS